MTLLALKVLVVRLYVPRASSCRAGVVARAVVKSVAKVPKALKTLIPGEVAAVGLPYENSGVKVAGTPAAPEPVWGTICGDADAAVRTMLSGPIRITPELKFALLKSMVIKVPVSAEKGALVPGLFQ